MRPGKCIWLPTLLTCAFVCGACGYTSESLLDPQNRTVYVDTYRGFEVSLTRALINEINAKTDLRIVPRDQADTLITGNIADFRQHVLTEDEHDNIRETEVRIFVNMTWTDRRTDRPIRRLRNVGAAEQIKWELGQTLESETVELFRDLAERLVERMEANW